MMPFDYWVVALTPYLCDSFLLAAEEPDSFDLLIGQHLIIRFWIKSQDQQNKFWKNIDILLKSP